MTSHLATNARTPIYSGSGCHPRGGYLWKTGFALVLVSMALGLIACQTYSVAKTDDFSDLEALPADTGGTHSALPHQETRAPYGFYVYTPSGYETSSESYPLLVFLHGTEERGNSAVDAGVLDAVLSYGPPRLIEDGQWNPTYPMIVASPQCHDEYWQPKKLDSLLRFIAETYRVDENRIYLAGASMGGGGVHWYLTDMGSGSRVAAAVAVCGEGNPKDAGKARVPIWVFHGEADDTVPLQRSLEMVEGYVNVPEAKLTLYPGVSHNAWDQTFDLTGMGNASASYDPYDISVYDWLLSYVLADE